MEPFSRDIYIKNPVPEFELKPHQCLKLLKPLHGLIDAGDLWHATIEKHHHVELGMKHSRHDCVLYYIIKDGVLKGRSTAYVDDHLRAGNCGFRDTSNRTNLRFKMEDYFSFQTEFTRFRLDRTSEGEFIIDQTHFLKKLE